MIKENIKEFLTPKDIKALKSEFNCSGDMVRKVCYLGTRNNHKMLLRALDLAIQNKQMKKKEQQEIEQKFQLLKQA
jgi:hypothetical protein